MKTFIKSIGLILSMAVASVVFASHHANSNAPDMGKKDAKKAIMVSRDKPEFTVTLPANPTTGYSWYLKYYPTKFITPVSSKYQAPDSKRVGAGSMTTFTFKVNPDAFTMPHIFRLKLVYAQAWNLKDATKKIVYVTTTGK